jgi:hypothetical protein
MQRIDTYLNKSLSNIDKVYKARDSNGKLTEGRFKYPNVLAVGQSTCVRHGQYTNEKHGLPSGKIIWTGCPVCEKREKDRRMHAEYESEMRANGFIKNCDGEWERFGQYTAKPAKQNYKYKNFNEIYDGSN